MSKLNALTLVVLVGAFANGVLADTLDMRPTSPASRFDEAGKPTRGMTQARVEARYGEPQSREQPVGQPPISRWEYGDFIVYFEYDKVIHSVSRR